MFFCKYICVGGVEANPFDDVVSASDMVSASPSCFESHSLNLPRDEASSAAEALTSSHLPAREDAERLHSIQLFCSVFN